VASKANPFARFLPARLRQDEATLSSDFVAAHHSSITWYLNRRLTEASQSQKEMQEERVKRQLERSKTLGSGAAREALNIGVVDPLFTPEQPASAKGSSWLGGASSSLIAATIGAPSPSEAHRPTPSNVKFADISPPSDDEDDGDIELSASQILQFETENANILRNVQDTLESVQQAESRLMDISALQMELVTHLTRQTELTDQLYEDAIATTSTVEKGNVQLKEAKRRAKDGRLFILVFLIGASLSLLFLHYY
jgi:syntaxin 18